MAEAHNPWNTTPLPLWASDFFTGTLELTDAQRGCYIQLLCYQWFNGSIPSDPQLAAKSAATSTKLCRFIVPNYFEVRGDRAVNLRLEEAREEIEARRRKLSERGKLAAEARWSGEPEDDANSNAQALPDALQDAKHEQCPPSPTHTPSTTEQLTALSLQGVEATTAQGNGQGAVTEVEAVWQAYLAARDEYHQGKEGRTFRQPKLTKERRALIKRRLNQYPVAELSEAVRGIFLSPHNCGQNDRGEEFLGIEIALRVNGDRNNVERFAGLFRNGGPKAPKGDDRPRGSHGYGSSDHLKRKLAEIDAAGKECDQ